tara:strand:+ start:10721 stop:13243 length:2523 start_codon:yes stop_codon:yes gene_type:complete
MSLPAIPVGGKYLTRSQINKNRDLFLKEPGVAKRISQLSKSLGVSPEEILYVFEKETAGSFSPSQKNLGGGNAVGLIQFLDTDDDAGKGGKTINGKFYKHSDLEKMSTLEQLDVVDEYFKENFTSKNGIPGQLYLSISRPASVGADPNDIAYAAGSAEANQNSGWQNSDGAVTVGSLMRFGSKPEFADWIPEPDKPYDVKKSSAGEALDLIKKINDYNVKYNIPAVVDGDNSYFMGSALTYKTESRLPVEEREDIKQKLLEYSQSFTDNLSYRFMDSGGDKKRGTKYLDGVKKLLGLNELDADNPDDQIKLQNTALYVNKLIRDPEFKSLAIESHQNDNKGENFIDMLEDRSFDLDKVWGGLGAPKLGSQYGGKYSGQKFADYKQQLIDELKNNEYVKNNFRQTKKYDTNFKPVYDGEKGDIDYKNIQNWTSTISEKIKKDKVPLLKDTPLTPEVQKEETVLTEILEEETKTSLLDLDSENVVLDQELDVQTDSDTEEEEDSMDSLGLNEDGSPKVKTDKSSDKKTETFNDAMGNDNVALEETFLDKIGGVSSLIGLATGAIGLGQALKNVNIPKDPKLGPAFQQRLEESKRMAQQGLTPSELAKAHNDLNSSYATGIDNIVRGSAGNRAQFMAGLGGLDVARQSALMDIAVADAQMQRQNQEKYDGMMMMNEQYEAARESKYNNAKFEQDMMNKQAGAALAGSALNMVVESVGDRQLNRLRQMQTQKMMRDMGYVPDSKGKSAQDKYGTDKNGNDLLADINSLTSEGAQKTGLIEGLRNKFKINQEAKNREQQQNQALLDHQKRLDGALNDIKLKQEEESFMNFANQYPGLLGGSSLIQ